MSFKQKRKLRPFNVTWVSDAGETQKTLKRGVPGERPGCQTESQAVFDETEENEGSSSIQASTCSEAEPEGDYSGNLDL